MHRLTVPATRTAHANIGAAIGILAGVGAIIVQGVIALLTAHAIPIPAAELPAVPIVTGVLGYLLPFLIFRATPAPGPSPQPEPVPPPPAGGA